MKVDKNKRKKLEEGSLEVLLETFITGNAGQSIINQEKRGQQETIREELLPQRPSSKMDEEACKRTEGYPNYKELYGKMGIQVLGKHDDIFYKVKLPKGWKIRHAGHRKNELIDEKERLRGAFFYKAAFYDRYASMIIHNRFYVERFFDMEAHQRYSYDELWRYEDIFFMVKDRDGEKVLFRTESLPKMQPKGNYDKKNRLMDKRRKKCRKWLKKHHPNWQDPLAYWDEN